MRALSAPSLARRETNPPSATSAAAGASSSAGGAGQSEAGLVGQGDDPARAQIERAPFVAVDDGKHFAAADRGTFRHVAAEAADQFPDPRLREQPARCRCH